MKNQFNLNIKTPCSENFNQFKPTSTGGFCGSCEKEVIDFTKMNAQEIINYFETQHNKNTCGRFKSQQLRTDYKKPIPKTKISILSGISLAILSFLSMTATQAQNVVKSSESDKNTSEIETSKSEKNISIKGYVTEQTLALPGVNVVLEGTTVGTQTDFDGYFEFPEKLKKGDVLVFSSIGMQSQKVIINNENSASTVELKIDMKMDSFILMGKVAVKSVYRSKK